MNPDAPLTPREELEIRITALLMGQLPPEEAAELLRQISADPELIALHARLRHAVELLREARALPEHPAPEIPLQLSTERREKLLATFRGIKPMPAPKVEPSPQTILTVRRKKKRDWKWVLPMAAAAAVMFVLGGLFLPNFSRSTKRAQATAALNDLRMIDEAIDQHAMEGGAPESPTAEEARDYLRVTKPDNANRARAWASQPGASRSFQSSAPAPESISLYAADGTVQPETRSKFNRASTLYLPQATAQSDPASGPAAANPEGALVGLGFERKRKADGFFDREKQPIATEQPQLPGTPATTELSPAVTKLFAGNETDLKTELYRLPSRNSGGISSPMPATRNVAVATPPPPSMPAPAAAPVAEPQGISKSLATAGKVNVGQPLAPVTASAGTATVPEQTVAASSGGVAATAERELQRRMLRNEAGKDGAEEARKAVASNDGEKFLDLGRLDLADKPAEQSLAKDRDNKAAERRRQSIADEKEEFGEVAYNSTRTTAMREVTKETQKPYRRFDTKAADVAGKGDATDAGIVAQDGDKKLADSLFDMDGEDTVALLNTGTANLNAGTLAPTSESLAVEQSARGTKSFRWVVPAAPEQAAAGEKKPVSREQVAQDRGGVAGTLDALSLGRGISPLEKSSEGKEGEAVLDKSGAGTLTVTGGSNLGLGIDTANPLPALNTPTTDAGLDVTSDYFFETANPAQNTQQWFGTVGGGAGGRPAVTARGRAEAESDKAFIARGDKRLFADVAEKQDSLSDESLAPQIVEFEGFINYGSPISTKSMDVYGVETENVITPSVVNENRFGMPRVTKLPKLEGEAKSLDAALPDESLVPQVVEYSDSGLLKTKKLMANASRPLEDDGIPQLGEVQATVTKGKPLAFTGVTSGNRSGNLAISENAIDALLFGGAGLSAIAPDVSKELGELQAEKIEPAVDILSSTATATPAKPAPIAPAKKAIAKKPDAKESKLAEKVDDFALLDLQTLTPPPSAPASKAKGAKAVEQLAKSKPAPAPAVVALQQKVADPEPPAPPQKSEPPIPQPEVSTKDNAFSTFSLNVSDVSFKLAGAALEKGAMPEPAGVRSEEFINALDYRDPEPAPGAPLAFASERARYPFAHNRDLLRLSVKTAAAGRQPGRPLNLVLLLDNSGSMERADRVRILKEALTVLAKQLQPADKLSIITFSRTPRLWADGVAGNKATEFTDRVGEITPQGGTDLGAAMDLGYTTALKHYQVGSVNRVVLLTDGAANLGDVSADALKAKVETHRKQGVAFDCFGVGWEGYNDDLLEQLSRNGDGRYGFINTPEAATTEFAAQLAGALRVAASDVKVQVEFNPARVTAYRQLGYAKHQLKKEQFRDNTVDAAEIGAAESGNALYAVEVNPRGTGDLATVRVRYKIPGTADYHEHEWTVPFSQPAPPLEHSSSSLKLAATAAAFSEFLAQNPFAGDVTTDRLLGMINGIPAIYGADPRPAKLEWMIRQAKSISGK